MIKSIQAAMIAISLVVTSVIPVAADTISYTYDALGRVVTVTYSTGKTITYTYDAAGNRTQVTQS